MHYNKKLADQQGLTTVEREALDATYELLFDALQNPETHPNVASVVTLLEYRLQELWLFPQDPKFHRYQIEIKGCTCPKMDNRELFGYDASRYRVSDCPWHWTRADREYYESDEYKNRKKRWED